MHTKYTPYTPTYGGPPRLEYIFKHLAGQGVSRLAQEIWIDPSRLLQIARRARSQVEGGGRSASHAQCSWQKNAQYAQNEKQELETQNETRTHVCQRTGCRCRQVPCQTNDNSRPGPWIVEGRGGPIEASCHLEVQWLSHVDFQKIAHCRKSRLQSKAFASPSDVGKAGWVHFDW